MKEKEIAGNGRSARMDGCIDEPIPKLKSVMANAQRREMNAYTLTKIDCDPTLTATQTNGRATMPRERRNVRRHNTRSQAHTPNGIERAWKKVSG